MGIFPSTPPSTDTATINMIASFDYEPKGKNVVESTSLSPHEAMYDTIQTFSDDHTNDLLLRPGNLQATTAKDSPQSTFPTSP